jgi:hypothetical protein
MAWKYAFLRRRLLRDVKPTLKNLRQNSYRLPLPSRYKRGGYFLWLSDTPVEFQQAQNSQIYACFKVFKAV